MRVARSGGWMSATRPDSKRSRSRSSSACRSLGRAVGGEHDLAAGVIQRVEGVEELLLGAGLALQELDVVDEQHVDVAEARLEGVGAPTGEGVQELVRESPPRSCMRTASPGLCGSSRLAIELSRCVLPTPGGPQMNSGL